MPTKTATQRMTLAHSLLNLWGSPRWLSMQGYSRPTTAGKTRGNHRQRAPAPRRRREAAHMSPDQFPWEIDPLSRNAESETRSLVLFALSRKKNKISLEKVQPSRCLALARRRGPRGPGLQDGPPSTTSAWSPRDDEGRASRGLPRLRVPSGVTARGAGPEAGHMSSALTLRSGAQRPRAQGWHWSRQ